MSFTKISKVYELLASSSRLDMEVPQVASWLGNAKRVLDLGCGLGAHSYRLKQEYGYEMVGVDVEVAMVNEGRRRYPGLDLRLGDLCHPPEGPWDAILCLGNSVACIEREMDWSLIFSKWKAVMAPKGKCLVQWAVPPEVGEDKKVNRSDEERNLEKSLSRKCETTYQLDLKVDFKDSSLDSIHESQRLQVLTPNEIIESFEKAGWSDSHYRPPGLDVGASHHTVETQLRGNS
jgi:SAM-dependent methyltransferase